MEIVPELLSLLVGELMVTVDLANNLLPELLVQVVLKIHALVQIYSFAIRAKEVAYFLQENRVWHWIELL